ARLTGPAVRVRAAGRHAEAVLAPARAAGVVGRAGRSRRARSEGGATGGSRSHGDGEAGARAVAGVPTELVALAVRVAAARARAELRAPRKPQHAGVDAHAALALHVG